MSMGMVIFGHLWLQNPWIDSLEIWHVWLRQQSDNTCKIWWPRKMGGRVGIWVWVKLYPRVL